MPGQFTSFSVTTSQALKPFRNLKPAEAGSLFFSVEAGNIRFMYHGGDPTRDNGHLVYNGQSFTLTKVDEVISFAVIAESGNPIVSCTIGGQ